MTDQDNQEKAVVPSGMGTELELAPSFVVSNTDIKKRMVELQDFVKGYMVEGEDFGTIPGTQKPTLYKSGAEKLCDVYGFQRMFDVINRVEDWDRGLFHYEVRCNLVSMRTGHTIAQGLGSANTKEERYRWRNLKAACPTCGKELRKSKRDPEWYCWSVKGGCGATFPLNDIQPGGRVENDEPWTLVNTMLKMAKKRALVDAVLSATRSSGLFTQDMEDIVIVDAEVTEIPFEAGSPEPEPPVQKPPKGTGADTFSNFWGNCGTDKATVYKTFGIEDKSGSFRKYVLKRVMDDGRSEAEVLDMMIEELRSQ